LLLIEDLGRTVLMTGGVGVGVSHFDVSDPRNLRPLALEGWPSPPDPTIYGLLRDSQARVYVCTNNGVQKLTPAPSNQWDARVFRRTDGLVHDECNTGAQFIDRHDRLWIGTLAGLSLYDPSRDRPLAEAPSEPAPLRYLGIRVGDQDHPLPPSEQPIVIPAGQRDWRLGYTLLSGHNEPANRYRGWLESYEDAPLNWTGENRRVFSNVPPGRYRFHLEAMDASGRRSSAPSLAIVVEPRFWQRTWVQGLLALLLLSLLAAVVRIRLSGLRQRQQALERLVSRRTEELETANQRLTALSYQDPLTGIANRRRLLSRIESELRRAIDEQKPIALLIIDVDHFKAYNDSYGHLAGDVALKAVAWALQQPLRQSDLLARFGGEEFACLLTDTEPEQAHSIAERMRAAVAGLGTGETHGLAAPVTISVGLVSGTASPGMVADDLLRPADEALYRAKHEGRNRVWATALPG
jgi:diguanylate cyclase (GGDEF)-like protein